jgi:hypothetical protein
MLRLLWKGLIQQEALIAELEATIEEVTRPFASKIDRLRTWCRSPCGGGAAGGGGSY